MTDDRTSAAVSDPSESVDQQSKDSPSQPDCSKRLLANRQNATKSTGPRTLAGKLRSRRNAVKHGVLASKALIAFGQGAEDTAAYRKLLADLYRDFSPQGRMEEVLVEKIAVCIWKQGRFLAAERAIIQRQYVPSVPELDLHPERTRLTDHLKLPATEDLDRLVRYEAAIQRQLDAALRQLEHLQEARCAEPRSPSVQGG